MTKPTERPIYRVVFTQQEEMKEIYAQFISEETLVGFIEVDTLLEFGQTPVVNVKEVRRCYIPLHNIARIDEIYQQTDSQSEMKNNISQLPQAFKKSVEKQ